MSTGFSPEAWSRIPFIDGPLRDGCGTPFEYDLREGVRCADCMAKPRAFARGRAACLYDDASRGVILQLKHADRTDLAPLLARWISRSARDLLADADAIAPVPLHPSRLLGRRYNQAAEIARPLSRLTGVPYLPDAWCGCGPPRPRAASRDRDGGAMWPPPSPPPPDAPIRWPASASC